MTFLFCELYFFVFICGFSVWVMVWVAVGT